MKIFYGSAIQGTRSRDERVHINRSLINVIRDGGYELVSEHTGGGSYDETATLLEESIGPLPPVGDKRTIYVRNKMIESVEGDICAAVFEVSVPSLGTGIEIAHAYLRPRMGLPQIPVLVMYEKYFWPNNLSSMIRGITSESVPQLQYIEYKDLKEAEDYLRKFLRKL